jgi:hypothetical protein
MSAGKGDSPRNCFSKDFRSNYDQIKWGRPRTLDEICGLPKGSFQRNLKEESEKLRKQEELRKNRIKKTNVDVDLIEIECQHCNLVYCECNL